MPEKETFEAISGCFHAFSQLYQVLGPGWTLLFSSLAASAVFVGLYLRGRQADKHWERVIEAKDDMIAQINEQNRELRVQAMVMGGQFTKEEAANLVYGENRLQTPSVPPTAQRQRRKQ